MIQATRVCRPLLLGILLSGVLAEAGCTRRFFRNRADKEVVHIVKEKDRIPNAKVENWDVYPPADARFADPTNPDRPPMPPDDPIAKLLAPNPQKPPHKAGVARIEGSGYLDRLAYWDAQNRDELGLRELGWGKKGNPIVTVSFQPDPDKPDTLPPPQIVEAAPTGPKPFLLKMDQAVELGLINSREYQTRREDLYLVALPVTTERFAFAAQFLAFEDFIRESTGRQTPEGKTNRWRLEGGTGFSKLFPTGALLLVAFANRTAIDFAGTQQPSVISVSNLNLDIVQPLLRGGGKAVTLEPLTQTERNLLYQIRSYARFRKEFFQNITAGGEFLTENFFTGVGGGGNLTPGSVARAAINGNFVSPQVTPGPAGRLDLSTAQLAPSEGYMPVVLSRAIVDIERKNVQLLENSLKLFQAYEEGGEVSSLQVGQVQLQLLQRRSLVLNREQAYRDSLDRFKFQIGVPNNLPLDLEDSPIRPITKQLEDFETAINDFEAAAKEIDRFDNPDQADKMRSRIQKLFTESALVQKTKEFQGKVLAAWKAWEGLDNKALEKKLDDLRVERRKLLDLKDSLEGKGLQLPEPERRQLEQIDRQAELGELEYAVRRYETEPWKLAPTAKDRALQIANRYRDVRNMVILVLGEASNERLRLIRPNWPKLPPVTVCGVDLLEEDLDRAYEVVTQEALANRLDLMNVRGQVVDAWRQLAVFANNLMGVFNVGYHYDSFTPPDQAKPLAFSPSRTRHQLVLNAELPLVRVGERNNYRASLIAYQRARRTLQAAEDVVANQVRVDLRQLRVLAQTYRIQQQAVELAYLQVESALETFRSPPQPGAGAGNAASAAALTTQLLNAYDRLPQAQNQLLAIWTNYHVFRQQLFLDMELMPLDTQGVWIDDNAGLLSAASPAGPEGPQLLPPIPNPGQK